MNRPTGISTYAQNLLPFLRSFNPVLLSANSISGFRIRKVPEDMSPAYGSKGHLKRLCWLQREVPAYCRQLSAHQLSARQLSAQLSTQTSGQALGAAAQSLLFSPLPEAPLYTGCRFVVTVHDTIPLRFPQAFPLPLVSYFRYYVRRVLQQAAHIICNSSATAEDIKRFYQISAHKITPIALAYDQQNFCPLKMPTENYFLYIGRHDRHKNVSRLISAFAQVYQANHCLELRLVGPIDQRYTPALRAQVASLGLAKCVHFLDYVDYRELPVLLGGAIALTFPSLWEGFGLPVLEAMACGTPVIASNLASLPEVTGDAALLINPYDVDALADAMRQVAIDASVGEQLRRAGLTRSRHFSWQKTGQQTAQLLKQFM